MRSEGPGAYAAACAASTTPMANTLVVVGGGAVGYGYKRIRRRNVLAQRLEHGDEPCVRRGRMLGSRVICHGLFTNAKRVSNPSVQRHTNRCLGMATELTTS